MSETRALVPISQQWADQATQAVQEEPQLEGLWVSTKGGVMVVNEEELPGNQMYVVILDSYRENTYFPDRYNADVSVPPKCYAFARGTDTEEMGPHESMKVSLSWEGGYFEPQHDTCLGCPMNEWGTADTGKGKACQNRRRLTLLPAGWASPKRGSRDFDVELFTDPGHYKTADEALIKLPVTSSKHYAKYVQQLSTQHQRPPHGVITRVYLESHAGDQFHVKFEMVELIPDEIASIVMDRNEACRDRPFRGYQPPEDNPERKQGSLKGVGRR